jgi:aryl-alcohol dehydrogenase-like predicted oxidoreductase
VLMGEVVLLAEPPPDPGVPGIEETDEAALEQGLAPRPGSPSDFRSHLPRSAGDDRESNQRLVAALERLAAERGVRPAQLAIAWARAKGERIVPVVGARTRRQLEEALGAITMGLSPEEITRIEQAVPASAVAGTRYQEAQMRYLDSER